MTSLVYMTIPRTSRNTIGCDSVTMRNGKNLFSTPIYVVWEHPGMMKSKQNSKQWRCELVTNSGKSDARYVIIPLPKMLFTWK